MSHTYKLKVMLEKDGTHLTEYDKEVYVATNQYTAIEPILTGLGIDMFGVDRVKAKSLDVMLAISNRVHYIINEMYQAGTLKDVFAELATFQGISVAAIINHITADLSTTVMGEILDAKNYTAAQLDTVLEQITDIDTLIYKHIEGYTSTQVATMLSTANFTSQQYGEIVGKLDNWVTFMDVALRYNYGDIRERIAELFIYEHDQDTIIWLGYIFSSMISKEGKDKAYVVDLLNDILTWVNTYL